VNGESPARFAGRGIPILEWGPRVFVFDSNSFPISIPITILGALFTIFFCPRARITHEKHTFNLSQNER
jgi:hypothetical protein